IVMAGYVLGRAGVLDGANALQTQSYGSESRGGACKSDVIISEDEILDLAPSALDVLVAMSQPALDRFLPNLREDGILIYDSGLVKHGNGELKGFGLSATAIAHDMLGSDVVANVIMLGCLAALTGVVSTDSLRQAISESVPGKTVELNLRAFDEGFKRGEAEVRSRT
ncbi:MAG: 2-oxoacid:acceptor oxidoreductase family protein, partial [Planctomycetes bacterium]|nr:2-oxoacid:acceptor oxidoreductase family protein [Planctomycetota bacterium]